MAAAPLRQPRCGGWPGSSFCADVCKASATLGATVSCSSCPVRSTCGAAQTRARYTPRVAACLASLARGFTWAASGFAASAAWRARCTSWLAAVAVAALRKRIATKATAPAGEDEPAPAADEADPSGNAEVKDPARTS